MDSILKRYHADLPLLEQARLGCISEREWLSEFAIALLWAPADEDKQWYLRSAMIRACKAGELPYQGRPPTKPGDPPVAWTSENVECYYITRDDFRRWLEHCGEWPLPVDLPLARWWDDSAAQSKLGRSRTDALSDAINEALRTLHADGKPRPTTHEVFNYLAYRDRSGTIIEAGNHRLVWRTYAGGQNVTDQVALERRLSRRKP